MLDYSAGRISQAGPSGFPHRASRPANTEG